jgi:hypothetical protein
MKDRRTAERRSFISTSVRIDVGKKGRVPNADQRQIPDRRLNNIAVEFISIDDYYYLTNSHNTCHS